MQTYGESSVPHVSPHCDTQDTDLYSIHKLLTHPTLGLEEMGSRLGTPIATGKHRSESMWDLGSPKRAGFSAKLGEK